jgi:hypothetical protein
VRKEFNDDGEETPSANKAKNVRSPAKISKNRQLTQKSSRCLNQKEQIASKKCSAVKMKNHERKEIKNFDMRVEKLNKLRIERQLLFSSLTFSVPQKGKEDAM